MKQNNSLQTFAFFAFHTHFKAQTSDSWLAGWLACWLGGQAGGLDWLGFELPGYHFVGLPIQGQKAGK